MKGTENEVFLYFPNVLSSKSPRRLKLNVLCCFPVVIRCDFCWFSFGHIRQDFIFMLLLLLNGPICLCKSILLLLQECKHSNECYIISNFCS